MALTTKGQLGSIRDEDISLGAAIQRVKMAQRELAVQAIPLTAGRVWDAVHTLLPNAGAADDLGIITGTLGTDPKTLQAGDCKAATVAARYALYQIPLPLDYEAGQSVTIRVHCGMKTTVSDTTATIDVEAYQQNKDLTVSADICATAIQSMNSATFAAKDFSITPTTLEPGDVLDVRFKIACTDGATGTAVIPTITQIELLYDAR